MQYGYGKHLEFLALTKQLFDGFKVKILTHLSKYLISLILLNETYSSSRFSRFSIPFKSVMALFCSEIN
jgi:hypothetical protein